MSAIAHSRAAFELRAASASRAGAAGSERLVLRASEDGWALLAPDGTVVFHALGTHGRHRCLQFARERGVLAVLS